VKIVGCAHSKIGKEFEVADGVGAHLKVANRETMGGLAAEGTQVDCCDGLGEWHVNDEIAGLLVKRLELSKLSVSLCTPAFGKGSVG
jgi:hypothetical protein